MSNFTSSFISTANLGQWDYYIMSDNTAVWRVLNGLAAWFSSSGGLIQNAALLGALLLLAIALFGAATHKPALSPAQLGTWFFFMCGMGMTGQANIYNIYTSQVTVVQNVPALALVPASMFSKAAYRIFTNMETAFQSTTGSYMSVSQSGFVGPLDILLTLRSPKLANSVPALSQSLAQVVHDCAYDPAASGSVPPISQAKDIIDWLYQYGRQAGMTKTYSATDASGAGTVMSCLDAVNYLNTAYTTMAGGSAELLQAVNTISKVVNPQDANKGLWTQPVIQNSFDMVIGSAIGMQQSAVQFTKNALVASIVTNTIDCMSQTGFTTTPDTCAVAATAMGDGMSQWETQTAMAGTGFLKTMFTSMGFLQVLFFALFPFIAIYGLIVVNNTPKIFGSYILFGIWSQSWLLVVAPIQSYIQTSVIDEMTKITAGAGGMTIANTAQVYTALATKLAVASDLMANSQMLSLALLSGSMVALSGLVGKWSGSQHMDTTSLQNKLSDAPSLVKLSPVASASQFVDNDGAARVSQATAGAAEFTIQSTGSQSSAVGSTSERSNRISEDRTKAVDAAISDGTSFGLTRDKAAALKHTISALDGFTGKVSAGMAGDLLGKLYKGIKLSGAQEAAGIKKIQGIQEAQVNKLAPAEQAALVSGSASEREATWMKVADGTETALQGMLVAGTVADLTGVGAVAGVPLQVVGGAGLALMGVGRSAISSHFAGVAKNEKVDAGLAKLAKKPSMLNGIASAIGGNVDAGYKAAVQDAFSTDQSSGLKSTLDKKHDVKTGQSDKLSNAITAAASKSYSESASAANIKTFSVTLTNDSILAGFKDPENRRNAQANSDFLNSDKGGFTAQQRADATKAVQRATDGRRLAGKDEAESVAMTNYRDQVLFENFLTAGVSNSMGGGSGLGFGAVSGTPNMQTTEGHAATKGKWVANRPTPSGKISPKEAQDIKTLRDWADNNMKNVDPADPKNAQLVAEAKHKGFHYVPGTPATESSSHLAPRAADKNKHLPTSTTQMPGGNSPVGSDFGSNGEGNAQYKSVRDRVIKAGDIGNQKRFDSLVDNLVALKQMDPKMTGEVAAKTKAVQENLAEIAIAQVAANAISGATQDVAQVAQGVADAAESAAEHRPGNPTKSEPKPKSGLGKKSLVALALGAGVGAAAVGYKAVQEAKEEAKDIKKPDLGNTSVLGAPTSTASIEKPSSPTLLAIQPVTPTPAVASTPAAPITVINSSTTVVNRGFASAKPAEDGKQTSADILSEKMYGAKEYPSTNGKSGKRG